MTLVYGIRANFPHPFHHSKLPIRIVAFMPSDHSSRFHDTSNADFAPRPLGNFAMLGKTVCRQCDATVKREFFYHADPIESLLQQMKTVLYPLKLIDFLKQMNEFLTPDRGQHYCIQRFHDDEQP